MAKKLSTKTIKKIDVPLVDEEVVKKKVKDVKHFWKEFEEFAIQGNAGDILVGVVIGTALKDFVKLFVENIIMPPYL